MVITETDIMKMRLAESGVMSDAEILTDLVREDMASAEFKRAAAADRYYLGKHDVLTKDFRREMVEEMVTAADGTESEQISEFVNPNRSNERTPNSFFWIHVVQKVFYTLGKKPSVSVSDATPQADAYRDKLSETTDAAFNRLLSKWATAASKGGKAWVKEYKDKNGELRQAVIGRTSGIPIYDATHENDLVGFIYHYGVEVRRGRTQRFIRTIAEWWTLDGVTYWYADGDEAFREDPERPGVQPHYWEVTYVTADDGVTMVEKKREPKRWDHLPFVELCNNEDGTSDLDRYKDLIDAYDIVQSMGTNNVLDFNEFWVAIQGFGGDTASAIARKLKINRAVSVTGQGGNIAMNQLDLNMQGRINWLQLLRDAIHEFGMAVDIKNEKFGNAPSGVALKFQYTLLDLKANMLISEMRTALENHFWFVTQEINKQNGTDFDSSAVEVTFNKSMITNDVETVNMINASTDLVPERILMAAHPLVTDPDDAMKEMEKQRAERAKAAAAAFAKYGNEDNEE